MNQRFKPLTHIDLYTAYSTAAFLLGEHLSTEDYRRLEHSEKLRQAEQQINQYLGRGPGSARRLLAAVFVRGPLEKTNPSVFRNLAVAFQARLISYETLISLQRQHLS